MVTGVRVRKARGATAPSPFSSRGGFFLVCFSSIPVVVVRVECAEYNSSV